MPPAEMELAKMACQVAFEIAMPLVEIIMPFPAGKAILPSLTGYDCRGPQIPPRL